MKKSDEIKVLAFYEHKFATKTMFDTASIVDELPALIKKQLVLHQYSETMSKVPLFHNVHVDVLVEICLKLRTYSVMPGGNLASFAS